jgi:hypothetical protein
VAEACFQQGNTTAGNAAVSFSDTVNNQNPSNPQTVNQVMNTVATANRSGSVQSGALKSATEYPAAKTAQRKAPDPRIIRGWTPELQNRVEQICLQIKKDEEDIRSGIKLRENSGAPIKGACLSYFATPALTITGTVRHDEKTGENAIEFTGLDGANPEVAIQLGVFPGQLHGQVQDALAKANFLKALLGRKVVSALAEPPLLKYLSRLMTLAIGEKFGSTGAK